MAEICRTITVCPERRQCYASGRKAMFHRWVNVAYPVGESLGISGPPAGQMEYTMALVELEDGRVTRVDPKNIRFLDSAEWFEERGWPDEPAEE